MAWSATPDELPKCVASFRQIHDSIAGDISTYQPYEFGTSVKFVSTEDGPRGGRTFEIERTGDTWNSIEGEFAVAPQGDPRWVANVFGQEAATYFGFSPVKGTKMKIPDAAEFIAAYEGLQARLKAAGQPPLDLSFKPTTVEKKQMSYLGYLRQFRDARALPIAPEGLTLIHDLSFHTPAMLLPKAYLDHLALQTDATLHFTTFLREKYNAAGKPPWLNEVIRSIRARQVSNVDVSTARVGQAINHYNLVLETGKGVANEATELKSGIQDIIKAGTTDGADSTVHIQGLIPGAQERFSFGETRRELTRRERRDLGNFYAEWNRSLSEDHPYRQELGLTVDELCAATQANRERVIGALKGMSPP